MHGPHLPPPPLCHSELCAGCGPAAANQPEFPGYVVYAAPKTQWPSFCFTQPDGGGSGGAAFSCSSTAGGVQRLCPCEVVAGSESQAAQVDGLGGGGGGGAAAAARDPGAGAAGQQLQEQQQQPGGQQGGGGSGAQ